MPRWNSGGPRGVNIDNAVVTDLDFDPPATFDHTIDNLSGARRPPCWMKDARGWGTQVPAASLPTADLDGWEMVRPVLSWFRRWLIPSDYSPPSIGASAKARQVDGAGCRTRLEARRLSQRNAR
jgi:hypothetical protein